MKRALLEVGIAQLAAPGEVQCGDRCFVRQSGNQALLGVIDGLGHGEEAANAAAVAGAVLDDPAPQSLSTLLRRCHERLRGTRGAALTLVAFDAAVGRLEWVGVGNVAAVLLHPEASGRLHSKELFVRGGVAGKQLPAAVVSSARVLRGDMVVAATDGVRTSFVDDIRRVEPPQQLAERLLARYSTGRDDALVVVACIQREGA